MSSDAQERTQKIELAKFSMEHNISLINLADTKAGIILGIAGVILGLLFIQKEALNLHTSIGIIFTSILLGLSTLYAFKTILPRFPANPSPSAIFFLSIATTDEKEFRNYVNKLSLADILDDHLINLYNISKTARKKYSYLKMSLGFIIAAITSLIITIVIRLIT